MCLCNLEMFFNEILSQNINICFDNYDGLGYCFLFKHT